MVVELFTSHSPVLSAICVYLPSTGLRVGRSWLSPFPVISLNHRSSSLHDLKQSRFYFGEIFNSKWN